MAWAIIHYGMAKLWLELCFLNALMRQVFACVRNQDCDNKQRCIDGKCTSAISLTDIIIAAAIGSIFVLCCLLYTLYACIKNCRRRRIALSNTAEAVNACENAPVDIPEELFQGARSASVRNSAGPPPYLFLFDQKGQKAHNNDSVEPGTKRMENMDRGDSEDREPEEPPPSYEDVFGIECADVVVETQGSNAQ